MNNLNPTYTEADLLLQLMAWHSAFITAKHFSQPSRWEPDGAFPQQSEERVRSEEHVQTHKNASALVPEHLVNKKTEDKDATTPPSGAANRAADPPSGEDPPSNCTKRCKRKEGWVEESQTTKKRRKKEKKAKKMRRAKEIMGRQKSGCSDPPCDDGQLHSNRRAMLIDSQTCMHNRNSKSMVYRNSREVAEAVPTSATANNGIYKQEKYTKKTGRGSVEQVSRALEPCEIVSSTIISHAGARGKRMPLERRSYPATRFDQGEIPRLMPFPSAPANNVLDKHSYVQEEYTKQTVGNVKQVSRALEPCEVVSFNMTTAASAPANNFFDKHVQEEYTKKTGSSVEVSCDSEGTCEVESSAMIEIAETCEAAPSGSETCGITFCDEDEYTVI